MFRISSVMFVLASGLACACAVDETDDGPDAASGGSGGTPVDCADLSRETIVLGGSLRYGECLEGCSATLTIGATSLDRAPPCDEVQLFVCDNGADGLCTEHGGTLTPVAHDLARRLAADLVGTALMPEYGCPDCADGGASTVELSRQGAHSAHRYETSNPPAELVAADAFVQGLIESLRNCASTENVDVFPGCVPRL